ncbi:MAG: hypothetical protein OES26_27725 [Gammaproteobacteria bacterium]|nr:hypothetical protein [Gammaproteobacteria bacterium]
MYRFSLALLLSTLLVPGAWSQDTETATEATEQSQPESQTEEEQPVDDFDLDEQSYADTEDDDFRPSEDIPADQSIPFPTDI